MASINSLLNHDPAPAHAQSPREQPPAARPASRSPADALFAFNALEPIEPSPPMEQHQSHSPTLDQYHHNSRSPEEQQRRQSLLSRTSPVPILAPIQNLTSVLHAHINGDMAHEERQPALVREAPAISQICKPEALPAGTTPHSIPTNTLPAQSQAQEPPLPSPQVYIKNEPSGTPRESTPSTTTTMAQPTERRRSPAADAIDADALKALEISKQIDLGLRAKRTGSVAESLASPTETKAVMPPTKKRPAPSAIKKKGTAALKKPSSKKRKLDPDELNTKARSLTPSSRASKAPAAKTAKKGSQRGTPTVESSPAPDHSSQAHASDRDEGESSEDSTLYCICRKPDNHTWMIACDGGCEDWFHGACVKMVQADEDLVDHFICPSCEAASGVSTTYKPVCRRQECRKPARVGKGKDSKYCSDECGVLFFQEQVKRTPGIRKPAKKKQKKSSKDGDEGDKDEPMFDDDDEPTPLGGVLRSKDLKALVLEAKNVNEFKQLGSGVLSPPQTASPTQNSFDNGTDFKLALNLDYTPSERDNLKALHTEKSQLHIRLVLLRAREKFVSMAREQAVRYAEREKIKAKDFCGYDSRLSWTDQEFEKWWNTKEGVAAFKSGSLAPDAAVNGVDGDEMDLDIPNGVNGDAKPKTNICTKKRCAKHPQWQKLTIQDARFEEIEVAEAIKEVEKEERQVLERAKRRTEKNKVAAELTGGGEVKEERNREGWVEVVGA